MVKFRTSGKSYNGGSNNKSQTEPAPLLRIKSRPLPLIPEVIRSFRATKCFSIPAESMEGNAVIAKPQISRSASSREIITQAKNIKIKEENYIPKTNSPIKEEKENQSNFKFLTTGIDFSDSGHIAAIAAQDSSITVVNCRDGTVAQTVYSKKYGVGPLRFTHGSSHVLFSSDPSTVDPNVTTSLTRPTGGGAVIRYLSLPDNTFVQYFHGHTDLVVDLKIAPQEDIFVSSSLDRTLRLWDLRSTSSKFEISSPGRANLAFDPTGRVLAVADSRRLGITLYDIRRICDGGFSHFETQLRHKSSWTSLCFTNDGKRLVLGTSGSYHHVFDSFTGSPSHYPLQRTSKNSSLNTGQDLSVTADGRFVLSGNSDGTLDVWNLQSPLGSPPDQTSLNTDLVCQSRSPSPVHRPLEGSELTSLQNGSFPPSFKLVGHSSDPISTVGFNPRYMMMVTGGSKIALWEPNLNNLPEEGKEETYINASLVNYKN